MRARKEPVAAGARRTRGAISVVEIAVIVVAAVVAGVCGLVLAMSLSNPAPGNNLPEEEYSYIKLFGGEALVVNLAPPPPNRYIRIKLELKVEKDDEARLKKILTAGTESELRSWTLSHLMVQKADDIALDRLRRQVKEGLEDILKQSQPDLDLKDVLVTEIMIE